MADTKGLVKVLSLKDLVLFGISSILGSGGFNLVGNAIKDGGYYFPLTLIISGALFMGSAHSYSYAHDTYKTNTSETSLIQNTFGDVGKYTSAFSILFYNIFATATILVFCAKLLFPESSWIHQVTFSLLLLSMMTFAAFQQLDVNKEVINIFSLIIILILGSSTLFGLGNVAATHFGLGNVAAKHFGLGNVASEGFKMPSFPNKINLYESLLFFFFILAGHDSLIKFSEETKDPKDIDRSMYISVGISILLTAGLCLAAITYITDFKHTNVNDIIADIFEKVFNPHIGFYVGIVAILCMLTTTFIGYLATIRYAYGLPEQIPQLSFIKDGGDTQTKFGLQPISDRRDGSVSHISILVIAALCMLAIFINQTTSLVELSDVMLIITLLLVSISAFYEKYQKGWAPVADGLTSGGLLGILGLTINKHFFN